jgi:hypothetical protein
MCLHCEDVAKHRQPLAAASRIGREANFGASPAALLAYPCRLRPSYSLALPFVQASMYISRTAPLDGLPFAALRDPASHKWLTDQAALSMVLVRPV